MSTARSLFRDFSPSTIIAGLIATMVGYTSSVVIVFAAARAFGADDDGVTSWVWAVSVGMGVLSIVPSLLLRQPVLIAWSAPGAAVLATANTSGAFTMGHAVGAIIVAGAAFAVVGFSGAVEKLNAKIPMALAGALLAGVLTRFAIDGFTSAQTEPIIVIGMLATYFVVRRVTPRYAVMLVLAAGLMLAGIGGELSGSALRWSIARPVWTSPTWSLQAVVSLAIPLFVVTMAGQNLPGIAVLRTNGYDAPVSQLIGWAGVGMVALGPFGGYGLNLSAITAAICMSPSAHEDPARRYTATVTSGVLYLALGIFATAITGLIAAVPAELVRMIAAIALLGTIASNVELAVREPRTREAAIVTFLVTISGVTLLRIGAAFWGAAAGVLMLGAASLMNRVRPTPR